ncbi:hypothetical protein [Rhodococcus phenolicus]|nr:hypothetical protein [Rhodococcus phenolicus]
MFPVATVALAGCGSDSGEHPVSGSVWPAVPSDPVPADVLAAILDQDT